ncbi:hypothetical protein BG000_003332 [Podila horticola]|nr:hypothetical protein BG000_003332 [Podila horticola]
MPTKRTRAASAKEQVDYEAPLNHLYEKIENRQWEEVINAMPLLEELLNHVEEGNTATEKALYTILAILTLEQSDQASQDPETWTYLKEMVINILQSAIDDGVQGKRKLFPRFLAALVGILTSEKDSRQNMPLRAKATKCISSLLCQSPENKRHMRSEMGIVQELANLLVEEQDIPLQLNLLGILIRISPQRLQDLNQFAMQLFSGTLVPPFLRVAPERFVVDAREFLSAVQATKPDAFFGWTLRSNSVRITSLSKVEPRGCYVDFNLLNMQVTPLKKGDGETLTVPYGDMVYWMFDINGHFILNTNENKAIEIKVKSKREATRIQRTMETAQVRQREKSFVPLSAVSSASVDATPGSSSSFQPSYRIHKTLCVIDQSNSLLHTSEQHQHEKSSVPLSRTFSATMNATPSFQPNNRIQKALSVVDGNNSPLRASEPSLRMNTKPAHQPTQTPADDRNKENIPPKASQGLLSQDSGGRASNSTVTLWLDSVESDHTPEPDSENNMEASIRSASRPLYSAPENGRGIEDFENEECHSLAPAHAQSTPATPLPGALRLDSGLRQQFLASLNLLGQAMFDQIEQRIQDFLMDEDALFQRLGRKVDEAVESRVREEFLRISRTIEAANTKDTRH